MPTLLQLNCTSNWGSTGKIAEQIGLKAIDAGWECYVAFGRSSNQSSLKTVKVGNKFRTLEHYAEGSLLDNEGLASRMPTKRLLKEIDKIHPDVVHLHNIHDHWMSYRILFEYLSSKQIPVVWTLHDCWPFTGHCYHFVSVDCDRWKTGCYSCPLRNMFCDQSKRNWNLKKSLFASHPNLIVVPVSQWMGDFVKESFLKDKRIEVIHNGIDTSVFSPQEVSESERCKEDKMILAVASAWSESKGLSDYYKLNECLPDGFFIALVGLPEEIIKKLPTGIIGLPRTQNAKELAKLYSMARMTLSLSKSESFGLTIAESLACGTPVIVYDNTAQPEVVDSTTGIVVETGNINQIVEAIKTLDARLDMEGEKISTACRKRAEECFDKDKCFEKYIDLYENLLR